MALNVVVTDAPVRRSSTKNVYTKDDCKVIMDALAQLTPGDGKVAKFGDPRPNDSKARGDARKMIRSLDLHFRRHPKLRTSVIVKGEGDAATYSAAVGLAKSD